MGIWTRGLKVLKSSFHSFCNEGSVAIRGRDSKPKICLTESLPTVSTNFF